MYNVLVHVAAAPGSKWTLRVIDDVTGAPEGATVFTAIAEVKTWIARNRQVHNYSTSMVMSATGRALP